MRGASPGSGARESDRGASCALSIVSPVYMGADSVAPLVEAVVAAASEITDDFEIILVEDCSPDTSWERIVEQTAADPRVKAIRLSRNFGQHSAILAGLEHAAGERVAVLDCDLQDDPAYLPEMYAAMADGIEVVLTRKARRLHSPLRNVIGHGYARTIRMVTGPGIEEQSGLIGNYVMLSRTAVEAVLGLGDAHPHLLVSLSYVGFDRVVVDIEHRTRPHGVSSYSIPSLVKYAVKDATLQSKRLLYFSVALGIGFVVASAVAAITLVILWATQGFLEGWTSIMCLILLSTGVILFSLGVIGLYLGEVLDEARGRPAYLVSERRNMNADGAG
ncbi:MAG: glycosyltransferase family 2 protein [Actinomycetota bacterium]